MSAQLINRSPDLLRLREEGHDIVIVADHLVVRSVPYVDVGRNIRLGSLVSELTLADDCTTRPGTHVMHFIGEYVLDQVAKTPVGTIDLFDPKVFLQHNAFRSPGAASREDLAKKPFKTDYYRGVYSQMHRGINSHPVALTDENLHLLDGVDFVFLCLDAGKAKAAIIKKLELDGVSFVDVGMGIELVNDELIGIVRLTTSTPRMRRHVHEKNRIPLQGDGEDNLYDTNIQTADLNMWNAAMAVMKWKKIYRVYMDMEGEHFTALTIDGNHLLNEDNEPEEDGDVA